MSKVPGLAFRVLAAAIVLFFGVSRGQAQAPATPPPAPEHAKEHAKEDPQKNADADDDDEDENPFAPQPAPTLPPGMMGSDANDPRAKLTPGV